MMKSLNYLWRVFATGVCFSTFGLGGLLLSITVIPILNLTIREKEKRQRISRHLVQRTFGFFLAIMAALGVAKFTIKDREYLASLKGKLVMANHPSLIDVVVLISLIPNADCVIKSALLRNPFMRQIIKATGYISNGDPEAVLLACEQTLNKGNNLIIFPEGTRTTPGHPPKLQRGAASVALRCQADVVILNIRVFPTTLTKDKQWYQVPEQRFTFSVAVSNNAPRPQTTTTISKDTRHYTRVLEEFLTKEVQQYE